MFLDGRQCVVWKQNENGTKTGTECTFLMILPNEPNNSLVLTSSGFIDCVDTERIQFQSLIVKPFVVTIGDEEGFSLEKKEEVKFS